MRLMREWMEIKNHIQQGKRKKKNISIVSSCMYQKSVVIWFDGISRTCYRKDFLFLLNFVGLVIDCFIIFKSCCLHMWSKVATYFLFSGIVSVIAFL
ncbi:hypothetical protein ACJX0J_015799, partial [Zea mays]